MRDISSKFIIILLVIFFITSCGTPTPPVVQVASIQDDPNVLPNEITLTKTFNQCNASGTVTYEVSVFESTELKKSEQLTLTVEGGAGADISGVAEASIKAALAKEYSSETTSSQGTGEKISFAVLPGYNEKHIFVWNEIRKKGVITYVEGASVKR